MNLTLRDSSIKLPKTGTRILLFLFLAAFASAPDAPAQSINEDLAPKKTAKKSSVSRKNNRSTVKTRSKQSFRKSSSPRNPVSVQPVASTPSQTPSQILDRFMDFQKSASVNYKDWESLIAQTQAALQENPNDSTIKAQLFIGQGQLAFNRNDFSNALIHFNGAAQVLPESALPVYCIGRVYLVTKQPLEAEKSFEKAVKLNKNFALAYKGWGDALTAQGKTKKAQEYYKQAAKIGLTGSNSGGAKNAVIANNQANNSGGDSQNNSSQQPNTAQTVAETPYDAELKSARQLTARKKWQNSLDKLTALSKTNPTAEVYIAIGDNYFGMRQWLSAQQAYRKAAEFNANSAPAFYKIGQVMFQMNEFQSAYEAFEKSLILDQNGSTINRQQARRMADQANEKARDLKGGKKGKKLLIF